MTGKAYRTLKKYSPKFPEWTRDFRRFRELFNQEIYVPENEEQVIWESIEELYATVLQAMITMSGIKDRWMGPEFLPMALDNGLECMSRWT